MRKILVRFDDICPTMDWSQWNRAMKILKLYHVKPLIGVIPDCQDLDLLIDPPQRDFWDYLKSYWLMVLQLQCTDIFMYMTQLHVEL